MKFAYTTLILAVLYRRYVSATVDLWLSPLNTRDEAFDIPRNELIDPEELKARLGKPPVEYNPGERYARMAYFYYNENWGPPCYMYYLKLNYRDSELGPGLSGHIGSVFVKLGAICRMAGYSGWSDLFHQEVLGEEGSRLGYITKSFIYAKYANCV
ncbi:hypothetical protein B0J13DRAFT_589225 [Dactylonectria estremocensis]|uniref:Uncharacterized protein n=1 Tax=Dactylonectria estremocensis TaxID=1079267 RepID=A0A9P9IK17_9HYPO|nr:hypothetical protein B0J13DRAFT_589225 [Dactylonectria estremocensis]